MENNQIKIGTLFSGVGSPEMAAKRVYGNNHKLVFACEWDKFARESFKANYEIEDKHFHKDIADMDGTQYKDKVDILVFGFPCQSFSLAGKRLGLNDPKTGNLFFQGARIVNECKPRFIIIENVTGLLSDDKGETIKIILRTLYGIGYKCTMNLVNTKDVGGQTPQNRLRLFIVGKRKD